MKKSLVERLYCVSCKVCDWDLSVEMETSLEIRTGALRCRKCGKEFFVEEGILRMLDGKLSDEIAHEKEHAEHFGYIVTEDGEKCPITCENLERFKSLLLSLPSGDGSHYFMPGGSFDNQAGNAERYFKTLELLQLNGKEKVLEVGSSFCWSPWRFAQRGCDVVALDVTNYLMAADLYIAQDNRHFERVMADMNHLPFRAESFDIIFSHSVIHHCKDLKTLFLEFHRVLKPGGRVVALHECSFGIFEDKSGKALQEAIDEGFNENAYTVPEWRRGALLAGFQSVKIHWFSMVNDYLYRKKLRKSKRTFKIELAEKVQKLPLLDALFNALSIPYRILFRPKAWMMVATKVSK